MEDGQVLEVACAIICRGEEILAVRRPWDKALGGQWEFPGGKVEPGESPEACVVREIREELDLEISVMERHAPLSHDYADFSVRLLPFACRILGGRLRLLEHLEARWGRPEQLLGLDWVRADLPLIKSLAGTPC